MFVYGIMAVSDKFNRLRLLIDSESANNFIADYDSFIKFEHPIDNIYGECIFTLPKKHSTFWLEKGKELRGKRVKIEFKSRKWAFNGKKGISFDVVDIVIV